MAGGMLGEGLGSRIRDLGDAVDGWIRGLVGLGRPGAVAAIRSLTRATRAMPRVRLLRLALALGSPLLSLVSNASTRGWLHGEILSVVRLSSSAQDVDDDSVSSMSR